MTKSTLAVLLLVLAAPAAASPAIAVVAAGDQLRLHLGELPEGSRQARFTQVVLGQPQGAWSDASLLPEPRTGTPFLHRGQTWFLETRTDRTGTLYDVLTPVSGEPGTVAVRLERGQDLGGAAVLGLDPWTFVVAEMNGDAVMTRVIESKGSSLEFEVIDEATWSPSWPAGTRLLAAGVAGGRMVVVGAGSGTVLVAAKDPEASWAAPPLDASGSSALSACVTADGPVVVLAREASLVGFAWSGESWSEGVRLAVPGAGRVQALSVTPFGEDRAGAAAVALLQGGERILVSSVLRAGSWAPAQRKVLAERVAPDAAIRPESARPSLSEVEARATRLSRLRWGLVLATFPVLVLLLRHLGRLRR